MARLFLRLEFGPDQALGPGKVRLLELVGETGSISAAGRAMAMSYKQAWTLIEDLNTCFGQACVTTQTGGRVGGGAQLTPFGADLIRRWRELERKAEAACQAEIAALEAAR